MQLSQKEKAFSQIAAAFLKSILSFEFKKKKKMTLIANFFPNLQTRKNAVK